MFSRHSFAILVSSAFALTPLAVAATAPAPAKDTTITVTGERLKRSEAQKRSHDFVSLTTATRLDQYSYRTAPVCPRIIGISQDYAKIVESRIVALAETIKIAPQSPNCAPNLFVLFTSDGDGLMALLRKAKPKLFANVRPNEQQRLFSGSQPMRWWHGNSVGNSEGGSIVGGTSPQGIEGSVSNISSSSQIDTKIAISLSDSVVVIDVSKSAGYPLEAVADYAAMVSLAQIRGDADFQGLPSILSLFSSGPEAVEAQKGLTRFDRAYLSSLYSIMLNRERFLQKNQIAGRMATKLAFDEK